MKSVPAGTRTPSRLLIESTVSYPLDHQGNDAGKCNFLVISEVTKSHPKCDDDIEFSMAWFQ